MVMLLETHKKLMSDKEHQKEKIMEFADMRKQSLHDRLAKVEDLIRKHCPLPSTYDVGRLQLPYFTEFTYGDSLDALYITPQSLEVSCVMAKRALDDDKYERFDFMSVLPDLLNDMNTVDKYNLDTATSEFSKKVVFPPGSNLFFKVVSKENLYRLMHEDEEVVIKPHPLSNQDLLRKLGRDFGYHRIIEPRESGHAYLTHAEEIWGVTASEMPIRAALMGKKSYNIGNFFEEGIGAYTPVDLLLFNKEGAEAKERAKRIIGSPLSGFFYAEDPNLEENIKLYFSEVMKEREKRKMISYMMPDHIKAEYYRKDK